MVRYLLDGCGADVNAYPENSALAAACQGCHDEIVDLLLERGADPNVEAFA